MQEPSRRRCFLGRSNIYLSVRELYRFSIAPAFDACAVDTLFPARIVQRASKPGSACVNHGTKAMSRTPTQSIAIYGTIDRDAWSISACTTAQAI